MSSMVLTLLFLVFQYEVRARLENYSGSSAISSADLFDEQKKSTGACLYSCICAVSRTLQSA